MDRYMDDNLEEMEALPDQSQEIAVPEEWSSGKQRFFEWLVQGRQKCTGDYSEDVLLLRKILKELELDFHEVIFDDGAATGFEVMENTRNTIRVQIILEKDPRTCRIDAMYPFYAEEAFVYPLCAELMRISYNKRIGCLKYDECDGELTFQYSYHIPEGLRAAEFREYFSTVLITAATCFDDVKKFAIGHFRRSERQEIICKAQELIMELDS